MPKNENLALKLGIQTYQILANDDEVCIPSLSSILLAVPVTYYLLSLFLSKRFEVDPLVILNFNSSSNLDSKSLLIF